MKRIAVVGVRLLGGAVAERLLGNGFEVTGYDVIPRSKVGSDGLSLLRHIVSSSTEMAPDTPPAFGAPGVNRGAPR
jgi:phosphoglycerate dehydrogenase-like enzyme